MQLHPYLQTTCSHFPHDDNYVFCRLKFATPLQVLPLSLPSHVLTSLEMSVERECHCELDTEWRRQCWFLPHQHYNQCSPDSIWGTSEHHHWQCHTVWTDWFHGRQWEYSITVRGVNCGSQEGRESEPLTFRPQGILIVGLCWLFMRV